jgi:hypothetical protein
LKSWPLIGSFILAGAAAASGAALLGARRRWHSETARMVERIYPPAALAAAPYSREELAGLPDPVARYFRFALTPGQSVVSAARLKQTGQFALRRDAWTPFVATEYFSVEPRGFLWDARLRIAGLNALYIRDGYAGAQGAMYGAIAAAIPVVNERGTVQMATGELLRYLAELVFLPTALLPRAGISWTPIDQLSARVTLTDAATTVSCNVDFGTDGEIIRISAMRYLGNDAATLTPWVGHFSNYRQIDGMMIPMTADVEWVLPDGPFSYWRGCLRNVRYDFARRLRAGFPVTVQGG